MGVEIRQAGVEDAPLYLDLLKSLLGDDFHDQQIYDPVWLALQLDACTNGNLTLVAISESQMQAAATLLAPASENQNPVLNISRNLFRPASLADGSAEALLNQLKAIAAEQHAWLVGRVLASDNGQQIVLEKLGFRCAGFQPFKHQCRTREAVLFYLWIDEITTVNRLQLSQSLPQLNELAVHVLGNFNIPMPPVARDGVTGYPLKSELAFHDASFDDYELWKMQAQSLNPPVEVSRGFGLGYGYLRCTAECSTRALLAQRDDQIIGGLAYLNDDLDRCLRVVDAFGVEDSAIGSLFHHLVKHTQTQLNSVYAEVDVLTTAPRLLKCAEQLGFVPVAYFPAFYRRQEQCADVVKFIKLNLPYSLEGVHLTTQARCLAEIVDHNFADQKVGVAVVNLLAKLPIFAGLGDGELRKIARLFVQKLYRPGELVFTVGEKGQEAFVVMRGQIDILLEGLETPVASMASGQIFGEQAFLDGGARNASAKASQASIVLVIHRLAFQELVENEPHLGMTVLRNIAIELSNKLRRTNTLLENR